MCPQPQHRNKRGVLKTQLPKFFSVIDDLTFKNPLIGCNQGSQIWGPSAEARLVRSDVSGFSPKIVPFYKKGQH